MTDQSRLQRENSELKAVISVLEDENRRLKSRLREKVSGEAAKVLVLLEDVYGDFVSESKKKLLEDVRADTDRKARSLIERHERIRDELREIQRKSKELQTKLRSDGVDEKRVDENGGKVKPIEYYLMHGVHKLEESPKSAINTPHFFKEPTKVDQIGARKSRSRSEVHPRRAIADSKVDPIRAGRRSRT